MMKIHTGTGQLTDEDITGSLAIQEPAFRQSLVNARALPTQKRKEFYQNIIDNYRDRLQDNSTLRVRIAINNLIILMSEPVLIMSHPNIMSQAAQLVANLYKALESTDNYNANGNAVFKHISVQQNNSSNSHSVAAARASAKTSSSNGANNNIAVAANNQVSRPASHFINFEDEWNMVDRQANTTITKLSSGGLAAWDLLNKSSDINNLQRKYNNDKNQVNQQEFSRYTNNDL